MPSSKQPRPSVDQIVADLVETMWSTAGAIIAHGGRAELNVEPHDDSVLRVREGTLPKRLPPLLLAILDRFSFLSLRWELGTRSADDPWRAGAGGISISNLAVNSAEEWRLEALEDDSEPKADLESCVAILDAGDYPDHNEPGWIAWEPVMGAVRMLGSFDFPSQREGSVLGSGFEDFLVDWASIGFPTSGNLSRYCDPRGRLQVNGRRAQRWRKFLLGSLKR